ncbi:MAG: hypothetical protein PF481_10560 [Bacteroidales bacterium]|jgi:hypothetical protein|nr:hypothetical protein [Bacteroidales bacterium]
MKLIKYFFLFITVLSVFSCSNKNENKHARIIWDKYESGSYKTVHQYFTDTAEMTEDYYYQEFYENGNLKIQGIENQRVRKGEWNVYFHNGNVKAKLNFDNDILSGPIELYDENGGIKAKDIAENGHLRQMNDDVLQFVMENFNLSEQRPDWNDSLDIMVDSLKTILNKN